jgi:hypothetical protein
MGGLVHHHPYLLSQVRSLFLSALPAPFVILVVQMSAYSHSHTPSPQPAVMGTSGGGGMHPSHAVHAAHSSLPRSQQWRSFPQQPPPPPGARPGVYPMLTC